MPTVTDITNSPLPNAQGKLKALWDAIRTTDPGVQPAPTPTLTSTIAAQPVPDAPTFARDPNAPAPVDVSGVGPAPRAQLASTLGDIEQPAPPVEAPPDINTMPGSARVGQLQHQVDASNAPPTLKSRLLNFAPLAAGIATAAIARGNSGAIIGGINQGQQQANTLAEAGRKNLTDQLQMAESEREKEYDVAQRTVEQANASREAALSRQSVARILGGSREAVADTNTGGRLAVANVQGGTARDVAGTRAASAKTVAEIAADARIRAGKYAADAAANRQTRSIEAAAGRQQAGFTHTDTKPTADEDRRADLAKSLSSIGDEITDIITRRPELAGPLAGRFTSLRSRVGTNDPDIAALMADKEALGQIALGAHAMRNAGHIAVAANSIVNSFNNEPEAVIAGIAAAQKNANTMQTITRPTLVGQTGAAPTTRAASPAPASAAPEPDYIYQVGKGLVPNPKAKR